MQKSKTFSGSIGAYNTATSRPTVYGLTANTSGVSAIATDFLLGTIADFLANDCGVDAAYEVRSGNAYKWLWVYGLPVFTYFQTTSTGPTTVMGPFGYNYNTTAYPLGGSVSLFETYSNGNYNFTLYYYGNPDDVCVLYVKNNLSTSVGTLRLCVLKTKNMITGGNSVTAVSQYQNSGAYNSYDLDENGALVWDNSISQFAYAKGFSNIINLQYTDATKNAGKLPLVNMTFGIHYCEHAFLTPNSDMVPVGVTIGTLVQPEFTVGGRTFINFANWGSANNTNAINSSYGAPNSNYTNLGLVEVTGT